MVAISSPVRSTDKKYLVYKGSRFWIYAVRKDGFTSYILTLAGRYDSWLLIENVYDAGGVTRNWRYSDCTFDFATMRWLKNRDNENWFYVYGDTVQMF